MNEELERLCSDLRAELRVVNGNPLIPHAVKSACEKTFKILEILIERGSNGRAA